jgi:GH24 family phage-related lysozyme (muramidase)
MNREVIQSIVMPGGWHKPEKDRLGRDMPEPIRADTYKELIEAVVKFRADNMIPIGNVREEVNEYICSSYPHMCHGVPGAEVTITVTQGTVQSLTDEMIQWLDRQVENHSPETLELAEEAQRRAAICKMCPYNIQWNSGCGSCSDAVNRLSTILRVGKTLSNASQLRACQILKHENRAAVWLRLDKIGNSPELPGECWAKR